MAGAGEDYSATIIDEDDLVYVNAALAKQANHWLRIGRSLGVSQSSLDIIQANHSTVERRLIEVLAEWLKSCSSDKPTTWSDVVRATEPVDPKAAKNIAKIPKDPHSFLTAPVPGVDIEGVDDSELDDSAAIVRALYGANVTKRWLEIGLFLGITYGQLQNLWGKSDVDGQVYEMVGYWVKWNYGRQDGCGVFGKPSWKSLVCAIRARAGGNNPKAAKKIADEHRTGSQPRAAAWPLQPHELPKGTELWQGTGNGDDYVDLLGIGENATALNGDMEVDAKTDTDGPSSAPATNSLYGQTYDQIVNKALAGSSKNFQVVNPMQNWTWPKAAEGYIDPQAYRFVGQVPTWSAVGMYEPSGNDMHQAYLQVLSLWNAIGEGVNEDQLAKANDRVTRTRTKLVQHQQEADKGYMESRKKPHTDIRLESYDTWMDKFWQGTLDVDKQEYDKAVETLGVVIRQKNPGLKKAIDDATLPQRSSDSKLGFLKVQIGTTVGVRPAYIFEDPKEWADRVATQGGGDSLTIELSASASSTSLSQSWAGGSTGLDDKFFSICVSGGWQMMDLVEDKTMKVAITIKAYRMFEVGPDTSWYNSGILRRMAAEDNWNPPFSTKGGDGKKPVFGKGGVLPLVLTGLIAGFQPFIDITMSDATYSKYKQLWDASSGVRVGPFQIGGSGDKPGESWSKNTDNKKFHVESKATYPFIMGITVANPGE